MELKFINQMMMWYIAATKMHSAVQSRKIDALIGLSCIIDLPEIYLALCWLDNFISIARFNDLQTNKRMQLAHTLHTHAHSHVNRYLFLLNVKANKTHAQKTGDIIYNI